MVDQHEIIADDLPHVDGDRERVDFRAEVRGRCVLVVFRGGAGGLEGRLIAESQAAGEIKVSIAPIAGALLTSCTKTTRKRGAL
jgi:hypothetical protein